jgi:outer membrane protein OmpA-like peptidoglycan-associated protein
MRAKVWCVALTGTLILLSAGTARADVDINHLPTVDPQTLSSSIASWSDPQTLSYSIASWSDPTMMSNSITTWSLDGAVEDLEETTHESGQTVVTLNADILFEFAKAALPPTAAARIAVAVTRAPKGSAVSIGGHTDDVGTAPDNLKLSQARAQAVAAAGRTARPDLVLTVKGLGESTPVATNGDAQGPSKNRRVEIRFAG